MRRFVLSIAPVCLLFILFFPGQAGAQTFVNETCQGTGWHCCSTGDCISTCGGAYGGECFPLNEDTCSTNPSSVCFWGDCLDDSYCCWPDTCNDYGSCYVTAGTCVKSGEDNCGGDCWDSCDADDIGCNDEACPTYCGYPGGEVEDDQLEPGTCNCAEKSCPAVVCATPTPDPVMPAGNFDGCDCSNLYGWACDADNYATPLDIHLYDGPAGAGGVFVGSISASQARADIAASCGGNPNHGFPGGVPAAFKDGNPHTIYAYAINIPSGNNPSLGSCSLTCALPACTVTSTHTCDPSGTRW